MEIYLDIETTGFSRDWDYIIEIAAIEYDPSTGEIIDQFHEYIKPGRKVPPKITELTGITNEALRNCRSEKEVLFDFTEWLSQKRNITIIGHNCKSFDLSFINAKCERYGTKLPQYDVIDTLALARRMNKAGEISVPNLKQGTIAAFYDIEYEAHSALSDAAALIQIYSCMKGQEEDVGF